MNTHRRTWLAALIVSTLPLGCLAPAQPARERAALDPRGGDAAAPSTALSKQDERAGVLSSLRELLGDSSARPPSAQAARLDTHIGPLELLSVEGRPIPYSVHGRGPDSVLIVASIHGNEAAGTPLLERLEQHLSQNPELVQGVQVVLVPALNPDGVAAKQRLNANRVDLNRNFPAANRMSMRTAGSEPLSEPESAGLAALLDRFQPGRVLSIHGWVGVMDWDGPAEALARSVGRACGLPAKRIGSRPGSLGSFVGTDRDTPILTMELPSRARSMAPEQLWTDYGPAMLSFIEGVPSVVSRASP